MIINILRSLQARLPAYTKLFSDVVEVSDFTYNGNNKSLTFDLAGGVIIPENTVVTLDNVYIIYNITNYTITLNKRLSLQIESRFLENIKLLESIKVEALGLEANKILSYKDNLLVLEFDFIPDNVDLTNTALLVKEPFFVRGSYTMGANNTIKSNLFTPTLLNGVNIKIENLFFNTRVQATASESYELPDESDDKQAYCYITFPTRTISKSRNSNTDAQNDITSSGGDYVITSILDFEFFVFLPIAGKTNNITKAYDILHSEITPAIVKSLQGLTFKTGLSDNMQAMSLTGDNPIEIGRSYLLHKYTFQSLEYLNSSIFVKNNNYNLEETKIDN